VIIYINKIIRLNVCWQQSTFISSSYLVLTMNGKLRLCVIVDSCEMWECCCAHCLPMSQRLLHCLRVSKCCPFFLLLRLMLRTRCLWCIGDMTLKDDNEKTNFSDITCLIVTQSTANRTWTVMGRNLGLPRSEASE
jgi:hypothetical protein